MAKSRSSGRAAPIPDDLEVREALLELVETSVGLMSRDLRALVAELQAHSPATP